MKLPNAERAVVDVKKLRDYCLNLHHPRGRHKARVFASSLGIVAADAEMLRRELLAAAVSEDVLLIDTDEYGRRYQLDLTLTRGERKARLRSSWIVRSGEDFPRLTSCYVL
jgi:hypothetical protein